MGGINDSSNLIYLYAQEHYYAHKLLAQENPHEKGLQLAWWNMCQCKQEGNRDYKISAEEYSLARINAAKIISETRKGIKFSEEHLEKLCQRGKPVINLTTGKVYNNAKIASDDTGVSSSHIGECCRGEVARAGESEDGIPYIWRFVGEEEKEFPNSRIFMQKKVMCIETQIVYESIREACRDTGVDRCTIKRDCEKNASRQKKKRLHFCYAQSK